MADKKIGVALFYQSSLFYLNIIATRITKKSACLCKPVKKRKENNNNKKKEKKKKEKTG